MYKEYYIWSISTKQIFFITLLSASEFNAIFNLIRLKHLYTYIGTLWPLVRVQVQMLYCPHHTGLVPL